ncbi:unnamed protein product [Lactuca saligna]|uniref:Uncharacterized protein n=1 Tax=Lactuca saligna TaxID=75948 RepID=A0AA36EG20_LACSI|nr:unnamed protein product [Lactuca saligna]
MKCWILLVKLLSAVHFFNGVLLGAGLYGEKSASSLADGIKNQGNEKIPIDVQSSSSSSPSGHQRKPLKPLSPWITDLLLAAPLGIRRDYFHWCGVLWENMFNGFYMWIWKASIINAIYTKINCGLILLKMLSDIRQCC